MGISDKCKNCYEDNPIFINLWWWGYCTIRARDSIFEDHITLHGDILDEEVRKARLQQLEDLDEKWIHAIEHQKAYHAKLKRAFRKNIILKTFQIGDLMPK